MVVDFFLNLYGDVLFLDHDSYMGSAMQSKMNKQMRAIKKFAKAHHIRNLDDAALFWVKSGCAERWAKQN